MIQKLTREECVYAMENGDFAMEICGRTAKTAIILTQSWCPQWTAMFQYLKHAEKRASNNAVDLSIFFIEYDKVSWFDEFMAFKENAFNNREIPYVRYYQDGKFVKDSNFISLHGFLGHLGIKS